jgi:amylosucrase
MAAALTGLETARAGGDPLAVELAVRRILLLYAVAFSFGGLPLIYMGDELGLGDDADWAADPHHADDNRWMHRPRMDWAAAERRHDPGSVEGRLWAGLRRLVRARRGTRAVHAQGATRPLWTGSEHVFGLEREHAGDRLLVLANFTAQEREVPLEVVHGRGFELRGEAGDVDGRPVRVRGDVVVLDPYQHLWLHA